MPPEERKSAHICVRLTEADLARLKALARKQGMTLSDLLMQPWREKKA